MVTVSNLTENRYQIRVTPIDFFIEALESESARRDVNGPGFWNPCRFVARAFQGIAECC